MFVKKDLRGWESTLEQALPSAQSFGHKQLILNSVCSIREFIDLAANISSCLSMIQVIK